MDKRTLTALVLMLVLYLAFDQFVWKPQRESARLAAGQEQYQETAQAPPAPEEAAIPAQELGKTADPRLLESPEIEIEERTLENDYLKAYFSNEGAKITSLELKNYYLNGGEPVDLIPEGESILGTLVYQGAENLDLSGQVFAVAPQIENDRVRFYIGDEDNPQIERVYTLDETYGIGVDTHIGELGPINGMRLDLSAGIADSEQNIRQKAQDYRFYLYADNELMKKSLAKIRKNPPQGSFGSFGWTAVRSKYFTLALLETGAPLTKSFNSNINGETQNPGFSVDSFHRDTKPNWEQSYTLYAGPADSDILKSYGSQMDNIAERSYNWLRWLANIFAWFLSWLHKYIKNYGVVIIIFALLIKLALHPLTRKSMTANFKMQKIQPQLQALQSKYKDDPKALQLEMSKLYKEAGANPMSGCLPLLLQMPIFFALYSVLRYSLDMRNASFVFWLKDLSEPDPYMILPITMALFMIIQSKMMQPKVGNTEDMDDKQRAAQSSQKMMTWLMPIMMFFIFRNMPAGLVLYWTVFNIFSIIQQYYLLKHHKK